MRRRTLDLVSDGLHEMGLAHADRAIEKQRVVGLGGTLGDRLAGGVGKLISAADDEGVKGVARIQLCGAIPIETSLRSMGRHCRGGRVQGESAVVTDRSRCRIHVGHELHILIFQAEIIECFLNQVGVLVTHVAKVGAGNAHEKNAAVGVTVTRGLEPGVIRMAVDFLFERIENAQPRIGSKCCAGTRHKKNLQVAAQRPDNSNLCKRKNFRKIPSSNSWGNG